MKLKKFKSVESYFGDMLSQIREQVFDAIRSLVESMGGAICTKYYHNECDTTRYTFYDTNSDGYGVELFVDRVFTENGKIYFVLTDTEDSYETEWALTDFNASSAHYLLEDLEEIAQYLVDTKEEIVTEYPEE